MPTEVVYKPIERQISPPVFKSEKLLDYWAWIITNGNQIYRSYVSTGSNLTIYEVPKGKTFFLVSALLQVNADSLADATSFMTVGAFDLIRIVTPPATLTESQALNLSIPLKFSAGTKFEIGNGSNADTSGTVIGFEITSALLEEK